MRSISGGEASRNHPRAAILRPRRRPGARAWNRRLHYYLGLYFLFFTWLFALSGLMLNHSEWAFASFWNEREEATTERPVRRPAGSGDLAVARDLMRQLGIVGEVGETRRDSADTGFDFQVVRPGQIWQVKADLAAGSASVKAIRVNAFGLLDVLHKFTGVQMDDPERRRDWIWTRVWAFAMDALAIGWIVLVVTGIYLWYRLPAKRAGGLVALVLGFGACAFFLLGLALL